MFQWSYFFLYVGLGFGVGLSQNTVDRGSDRRPIDSFALYFIIALLGSLLWNFITFGFSWGVLSVIEGIAGYFLGQKVRYSGHFH
jgi:hypothetical protein